MPWLLMPFSRYEDVVFLFLSCLVQRNAVSLSQTRHYPPETALFTPLPMLCMSSPMPRIVAHPSEVKTTKINIHRSNLFFFILPPKAVNHAAIASVFLLLA